MTKQGILIISRHGESEWNLLGKWTGWTDVGLTDKGKEDTKQLGRFLQDKTIDAVYTSALKRTHETLDALMEGAGKPIRSHDSSVIHAPALNERDYGDLTGKNKWEVKDEIGEEAFNGIRRGWDYPVPRGETLKDVYARVIPYFKKEILPRLQSGECVLVVSHGNTIRALMKYLDGVSDDNIGTVEMPFGQLLEYRFSPESELPVQKLIHKADIVQPKA
ncbi:MAG: 2,3-bisphosphoglycerate-dependent phosphoglycerate mutase [Candidatus Saccharimonas sp.]